MIPRTNQAQEKNYFIKEGENGDLQYWKKIDKQIHEGEKELVMTHMEAISTRSVNIYEVFYDLFIRE